MIEVELRGRLDEREYHDLKSFLTEHGQLLDSHEREMFLLRDYPGYDHDPLKRQVDIRLRNTSGRCEVMIKRKVSDNNVGREEVSIPLTDNDLEQAKRMVKAFGCTTAIWMHRIKDTFLYNEVEWSVVKAPKGIYYFEVEKAVSSEEEVSLAERVIREQARLMDVNVFTPEQMREFIYYLDEQVNEVVEL